MDTGFAAYHPALNFIVLALCIVGGMCFAHPLFTAVSLCGALAYYIALGPKRAARSLGWMLGLFALAVALNPVCVTRGDTVLFHWLGGRPFTLEALLYGLESGGMLLAVLLWFGCFNAVMTDDKLQQLFAPLAPALALAFSMTLRLVPSFSRRAAQIATARACVGKGAENGAWREKVEHGAQVLSALTGWALEGAVVTADSMRARGWGCGARTRYALWHFGRRELVFSFALAAALALAVAGVVAGGARCEFYPTISISPLTGGAALGLLGYGLICFLPFIATIWEEISWHISRSRI